MLHVYACIILRGGIHFYEKLTIDIELFLGYIFREEHLCSSWDLC